MRRAATAALFCIAAGLAGAAQAEEDRYAGYYYPEISSEENFRRVIAQTPASSKEVRVNFITAITKAQLDAPESPRFVLFEKGGQSTELIIVALDDEVFRTLFRARAVLAQLTSNLRGTEFFRKQGFDVEGTFFDMVQIMGFGTVTISDGATWAHRVNFQPGG